MEGRVKRIGIVKAYIESQNEGDVEATLAFLSDDFVLEVVGRGVLRGKEAARRSAGWDAAIQSRMTGSAFRLEGDRVVCQLVERNEWLRLADLPPAVYPDCRFTFREGLISHIRTEMAPESRQAFGEALRQVVGWAIEERPADLGRLLPSGEFDYGPRAAAGWLALLGEWDKTESGKRKTEGGKG